jgi:hypothetical protein
LHLIKKFLMIQFMKLRVILASVLLVLAPAALLPAAAHASGPRVCTWAGTVDAPTGTFTISPGATNTPSTEPSVLRATGALGGDCRGTLHYEGQIDAGSGCIFGTFHGRATGIPGVTRFEGVGVGPFAPARLYDADGNVVGSENANLVTAENAPHFLDCNTPQGFTGGNFNSVIVLTGGA